MGKRRSKKGKTAKNNPNSAETEPEELTRAPHSFVIHRGSVGRTIVDFTKDFRKVMEPFTASSLKVRKKNVLKDFSAVAGLLHVSHLVMFTSTETASYVRFGRFPRGPTLTFRMLKYSLSREVLSQLRKQYAFDKAFRNFPLVVLNNFSGEGAHMKLMATMFQNMFPTINLTKVNLDSVRRCVLFNYNREDKSIEFRHYGIRVAPVGLSRGVKKLVQSKVPNLGRYEDVSEFLLRGDVSESEAEDDGESHVTLPQKISSRGNVQDGQSAIRLSELGPRMTLQLIKVEGGLCEGEVIYHDLITKTDEEIALINKRREQKRRLKEERKRIQEKNKQEKERKKELLKKKSLEGIEKKKKEYHPKKDDVEGVKLAGETKTGEADDENDSDWYRKEVGQDPDKDLFSNHKSSGMKRTYSDKQSRDRYNKKLKTDFNQDRDKRNNTSFKPCLSKRFQQKSRRSKKVMGSKVRKGQRHR
ncbi:protein Peter pan-like [Homalodisca vitripennis]|uniref:protein Peter pan-like n=1 Tax=Homalodisca vitripennis TaxID=197043 RepID=UPI001EEAAC4E|nr:protein Peter pan-like [Homalodisca vitripennis]XP_046686180.1 protein Peter pan-like [Homalodisca vitripennis]